MGHTLTWEKGRQLKSLQRSGASFAYEFKYNANGIRISKTGGVTSRQYELDGAKIVTEKYASGSSAFNIVPIYDNEDSVCGIIYNDVPYYFHKNLQGDVIAIADSNGDVVARYTYDAWGVPTITKDTDLIALNNPFRYRGYYYDRETKLYYLQSRYYDPMTGRFINGDEAEYLNVFEICLCYSIYQYCWNNVVNCADYFGLYPQYIDNQLDSKYKKVKIGYGNVYDNGCGAIAAYNVLCSRSSNVTLEGVIKDLRGGLLLFGYLGVSASALKKYMEKKFWTVQRSAKYQTFWNYKNKNLEAVIVLIQYKKSLAMHYFAGILAAGKGKTGLYVFHNTGLVDKKGKDVDGNIHTISAVIAFAEKVARVTGLIGVNGKKPGW